MLLETFLPRIFFRKSKYLSPILGNLSMMLVKKEGLGLLNPVTSANKNYLSVQRASTEFSRALTGEDSFFNTDHFLVLREEIAKLMELVTYLDTSNCRLILHAKNTSACLNFQGTTVTGTLLSATEF